MYVAALPIAALTTLAAVEPVRQQFTLTPSANPELDRDNLVIGALLDEGSMQLLARLNSLPVNNYDGAPLAKVQVSAVRLL